MFLKKKILLVVLARGGSKGIKLKNLRKINGKSLVKHTGNFCKKLKFLDTKIVSTDHKLIAKEAIKSGFEVPFLRPKKLSGDLIKDEDVMFDVLKKTETLKKTRYDIIMSLPPTSPFRTIEDVTKCLGLLIKSKFDSVWTVSENDSKNHPYKQLIISKNNNLKHFLPQGKKIFARQQLGKFYFRNGCCYVVNRQTLLKKKLITSNSGAIISKGFNISIDTEEDLKKANFFYRK